MSFTSADGARVVLVRADDAETLGTGPVTTRLLVDSDSTDGAASANRALLERGAAGPPPHFHAGSAELFFVLAGSLHALAGDRVVTLEEGDFLSIPRGVPHAFAALPEAPADVLIVQGPQLRPRFDYFRLADRVIRGQASPQEILESQERFDNHFVDSPVWREARAAGGAR
jgi:quercetin dioxygenase-like cupin family protein